MLPEARFVTIVRNPYAVAAPWKRRSENEADAAWPVENDDRAAVPVWNESLHCALDALAKVGAERMAVLAYETTFVVRAQWFALADWLGIASGPPVSRHTGLMIDWSRARSDARRRVFGEVWCRVLPP